MRQSIQAGRDIRCLPRNRLCIGLITIWFTRLKYGSLESWVKRVVKSLTKFLCAAAVVNKQYHSPSSCCSASVWGLKAGQIIVSQEWGHEGTPFCKNTFALSLSAYMIQQAWQRLVCEWEPKPPILWAAGLSHTTATRITCTKQPIMKCDKLVKRTHVVCDNDLPFGHEGVGTLMPSCHKCNRSDIIGLRKHWISSGLCSFRLGRMLVSMRFDVWYLWNVH